MYKILGGDGKEYGPISADTVRLWIREGRANAQTQVQPEGSTAWIALGQLAEFAASFNAPPPAAMLGTLAPDVKIPNYLVQSILVTLCCCMPFGIVAIVYAAQVNTKMTAGDITGAQESSSKAKMWCWIAFGVGIITNIIVLALNFAAAGLGAIHQN